MSLCGIHSAHSVTPDPHASGRTVSYVHCIHTASLSLCCTTALLQCSLRLSLSAADPHASGRTASVSRYALTATLNSDYHCRFCRVCFVLSVDYRPSCFGSDNLLRSLHAHRIALLALFPLAGWLLTHPSFRQPPDLLHSLTLPFLCSCSLTQSLCSLMLRSSTPSFTSFTQLRCLMANASFRSSGINML